MHIVFFLLTLTPVSESAKVMRQKPTRCSLLIFKQLNYHDNTYQGRFLFGRRNFTILYKNPKRGDRGITRMINRIQSSERSLQLKWGLISILFNFSKQSPFQFFRNSLVWFWILYLWVKCNPKNSILQINSVQYVYVESCYKIFTSTYKKSNYNVDISNVFYLPFDEMCLFIDEWSQWYRSKRTDNRYVTQNNPRKIRWKCFDTVLGSDSKN